MGGYAVLSNNGDWDHDSMGVVGVIANEHEFRAFCDKHVVEHPTDDVPPSHTVTDNIDELYEEHELSEYSSGGWVRAIVYQKEGYGGYIPDIYTLNYFN